MNALRTHDGGCDQEVTLRRRLGEGRGEAKGNLSASLHLASLNQEFFNASVPNLTCPRH